MSNEYIKFPTWMGAFPRANAPWTEAEITMLKEAFQNSHQLHDVSRNHGRTQGAIEERLLKEFGDNFQQRFERAQSNLLEPLEKPRSTMGYGQNEFPPACTTTIFPKEAYCVGQRIFYNKRIVTVIDTPKGARLSSRHIWVEEITGTEHWIDIFDARPLPNGQY